MSGLDALPPLRDVVAAHGLDPQKSLGQNFLFDLNLTRKIARAAGPLAGVTVVEVGPGPGGLTRALLAEGAAHVIAVERDARCLSALAEIAAACPGQLTIVEGDATSLDLGALVHAHHATLPPGTPQPPARIVANLPYNVGTVLLTQWLESDVWPSWFDRLTLMFQREVAERIVATPQERVDYGRLAILCGWRTQARILFDVPASAFTPPPKVTSSIVELVPRATPLPCDRKVLSRIAQAAFGQRRKMLRQSLKGLGMDPAALLNAAGLEPTRRAEEIEVAGFVRLAQALSEHLTQTRKP